jgi:hypothetical protein
MSGCGCNVDSLPTCYQVLPVPDPVISPSVSSFFGSLTLSITCSVAPAKIYYTLDGSTPTVLSALYTGPFVITETTTVKAIALLQNYAPSNVVKKVYTSIVPTNRAYWGWSPETMLTGPGVNALQNSEVKSDTYGVYPFQANSTVNDYFYFWFPDYFGPPRSTDGFRDTVTVQPIVMAGLIQGFTTGQVNGWLYKSVNVNGIPGKLFRSYYQLGGGGLFDIEVLSPSVTYYRADTTALTADTTTFTADFAY